jgi:RNA polymerase sigma-70 factor, ECF subfamily
MAYPDVELLTAEVTALPGAANGPAAQTFEGMVREHWDSVYRLLQSLSGNIHDTEDLTQETFLRAWNRIDSFQRGSNLRSWLLKIASNAFFDQKRRKKRSKTQPLDEFEPAGRADAPGHDLEVAQQAARVREAMRKLSKLTCMVFHLRAVEGLSFREIAEVAATTEQSARWHMHHARTKLLELLGENGDGSVMPTTP